MRGLNAGAPATQVVADGGYGMDTGGYMEMMGLNYQNVPSNLSGYATMQKSMFFFYSRLERILF